MSWKRALPLLAATLLITSCGNPAPATTGSCTDHGDCPGAQFCINGSCTKVTCTTDTDCQQGTVCLSDGSCAAVECRANADCCSPQNPTCGRTCVQNSCHCGDCVDGQTEECFRACHKGQKSCANTCWSACDAPPVLATETCGDAIDNDCNGQTDEGCTCTPTDTRACESACDDPGEKTGSQTCKTDGTWDVCDGDCCNPGDSGEQPCGNCGFQQGVCPASGKWEWGALCQSEGVCAGTTVENAECGKCGQQTRTCAADCTWGDWSACTGEGVCVKTTTMDEECGTCGTWQLTCNDSCQWEPPATCTEGSSCSPSGPPQSRACGKCGVQTRDCRTDGCGWEDWSTCSNEKDCIPEEVGTDDCGNCGECTRRCKSDCTWDVCGVCTGAGECAAAATDSQTCGPGTTLGICEEGTQQRTCGSTCYWGSWGSCQNATYPSYDFCGDGVDQDCDGSDNEIEDAYESNDSCFYCHWLGEDPDLTLEGTIDSPSDTNDYFCFSGIDNFNLFGSEHINIDLSGQRSGMDLDIYLYDSYQNCLDHSFIAASLGSGNVDESISWEETNDPDDHTYYIRVRNWADSGCWNYYDLAVKGLR